MPPRTPVATASGTALPPRRAVGVAAKRDERRRHRAERRATRRAARAPSPPPIPPPPPPPPQPSTAAQMAALRTRPPESAPAFVSSLRCRARDGAPPLVAHAALTLHVTRGHATRADVARLFAPYRKARVLFVVLSVAHGPEWPTLAMAAEMNRNLDSEGIGRRTKAEKRQRAVEVLFADAREAKLARRWVDGHPDGHARVPPRETKGNVEDNEHAEVRATGIRKGRFTVQTEISAAKPKPKPRPNPRPVRRNPTVRDDDEASLKWALWHDHHPGLPPTRKRKAKRSKVVYIAEDGTVLKVRGQKRRRRKWVEKQRRALSDQRLWEEARLAIEEELFAALERLLSKLRKRSLTCAGSGST